MATPSTSLASASASASAPALPAARGEREAALRSALESLGLSSHCFEPLIRHPSSARVVLTPPGIPPTETDNNYHYVLSEYYDRNYPSLDEVVTLLAPIIRRQMLLEHLQLQRMNFQVTYTTFMNDPRCVALIEGRTPLSEMNSLCVRLEEERKSRDQLLTLELNKVGLTQDIIAGPSLFNADMEAARSNIRRILTEMYDGDDRQEELARARLEEVQRQCPVYFHQLFQDVKAAAQYFVRDNVGQADRIAQAADILQRGQKLVMALRKEFPSTGTAIQVDNNQNNNNNNTNNLDVEQEVKPILTKALFWIHHESKQEVRKRLPNQQEQWEPMASFLLGYTSTTSNNKLLTAEDVARHYKEQRERVDSRRATAQQWAAQYELALNLENNNNNNDNSNDNSQQQVKAYIEEGTGDIKSIITTLAWDEQLQARGLPDRATLFSKLPAVRKRFQSILAVPGGPDDVNPGDDNINKLTRDLAGAVQKRSQQLEQLYLEGKRKTMGKPDATMSQKERSNLDKTDYVRFGIGSAEVIVTSYKNNAGQGWRRKSLQTAMSKANPKLYHSHLASRLETDHRLKGVLDGRGEWADYSDAEIVLALQAEEKARKEEVLRKLASRCEHAELLTETPRLHPVWRYISRGIGDCTVVVDMMTKDVRKTMLQKQIDALAPHLVMKDVLAQSLGAAYMERKTQLTAEQVVRQLAQGRMKREQRIQQIYDKYDVSDTDINKSLKYASEIRSAIALYIDRDVENAQWIDGAVDFHFRYKKTEQSFKGLQRILPCPSMNQVSKWRNGLQVKMYPYYLIESVVCQKLGLTKKRTMSAKPGPLEHGLLQSISRLQSNLSEAIQLLRNIGGQDLAIAEATLARLQPPGQALDLGDCISRMVFSYLQPTYMESIRDGYEITKGAMPSENHNKRDIPLKFDRRIVLLLTGSKDCPWKNAEEAAEEMREERQTRQEQVEKFLGRPVCPTPQPTASEPVPRARIPAPIQERVPVPPVRPPEPVARAPVQEENPFPFAPAREENPFARAPAQGREAARPRHDRRERDLLMRRYRDHRRGRREGPPGPPGRFELPRLGFHPLIGGGRDNLEEDDDLFNEIMMRGRLHDDNELMGFGRFHDDDEPPARPAISRLPPGPPAPIAAFLDGKVTLQDVMLDHALKEVPLPSALTKRNKACRRWISEKGTPEEVEASLPKLISTLQEEREERCRLLKLCFEKVGVVDLGIGLSSFEAAQSQRGTSSNKLRQPMSSLDAKRIRFDFIDLGQGRPELVVRAVIQFQRWQHVRAGIRMKYRMENVVYFNMPEVDQKCREFAMAAETLPTNNEIDAFLRSVHAVCGSLFLKSYAR